MDITVVTLVGEQISPWKGADMDNEKHGFKLGESKMESNGIAAIMGYRKKMWGMNENEGCTPLFIAKGSLGGQGEEMWHILRPRNGGRAACKLLREASRTWVDGILRFMGPVGYGSTTLPLHHSDRKESLSINL
ncbi:hypothetical protein Tco_0267085 [Tanacetum coccineum]